MSRNSGRPYNLVLALVVLVGLCGVLGVSSLNVRVSLVGSVIVTVAVLESAVILGGIAILNRKRPHPGAASDSN